MSKPVVGKRSQVSIRSVWAKETEFSDWLITPEGIELISEDLEIQVENPVREVRGTNFPCDIVANMVGEEKHIVAIENQFGRTNHDHLGKLLTYAATHKAMTGIWIAEEVADDHREVIDWLNENTPNSIHLYLAELKVYSINGSPPAPQLDLICRPNISMKQTSDSLSESDRARYEWRLKFWQEIHDAIKETKPAFSLQKPSFEHWSSIALGRSGFHVSMLLTPKNKSIAVEVYVKPEWKLSAYQQLYAQKEEIESDLGEILDWREMPEKASSRIILEKSIDPSIDSNRIDVCKWFSEWTPKMHKVFQKRIKELHDS
jgi:hypothetical protein